ncbi:hypothetical protein GQ55_9G030400 [Panicum hallii var. hallii]|nr:hypothetical protein GQ55_9G030400 [Panicum hallii var. hallii]
MSTRLEKKTLWCLFVVFCFRWSLPSFFSWIRLRFPFTSALSISVATLHFGSRFFMHCMRFHLLVLICRSRSPLDMILCPLSTILPLLCLPAAVPGGG